MFPGMDRGVARPGDSFGIKATLGRDSAIAWERRLADDHSAARRMYRYDLPLAPNRRSEIAAIVAPVDTHGRIRWWNTTQKTHGDGDWPDVIGDHAAG